MDRGATNRRDVGQRLSEQRVEQVTSALEELRRDIDALEGDDS